MKRVRLIVAFGTHNALCVDREKALLCTRNGPLSLTVISIGHRPENEKILEMKWMSRNDLKDF